MRILFAGSFQYPLYEEACANAMERLGHQVTRLAFAPYYANFLGKLEIYASWNGPGTQKINQRLLDLAARRQFDVILIWRGTHITSATLAAIRQSSPQALLVAYNNDDPFSPIYEAAGANFNQRRLWRTFRRSIPHYDMHFVFRKINVKDYLEAGAKYVQVLLPYYVSDVHYPSAMAANEIQNWQCEAVFVGHYEPDGREHYIRALVEAGVDLRLYGGKSWSDALGATAEQLQPIRTAYGGDYIKALQGADMCLCFLSKLNRDTYTTRCFEIPACGKLLLSERTQDLTQLFREDEEAVFFDSTEELLKKVKWLKAHPDQVLRIAQAGMRRLKADRHSVDDRMAELLSQVELWRAQKF